MCYTGNGEGTVIIILYDMIECFSYILMVVLDDISLLLFTLCE